MIKVKYIFILFVSTASFLNAQIDTSRHVLFRFSIGQISNRSLSHYRSWPLLQGGQPDVSINSPPGNPKRYYGFLGSIDASFKTFQPYFRFNLGINFTFSKGRYHYYYDDSYTDPGGTNIVSRKDVVILSSVSRLGIQASMEYRFMNAIYFNFGPGLSYQLVSKDILNGYEIYGNVMSDTYNNTKADNYNEFNPFFISVFLKIGYDFKIKTKSIGLFMIGNGFFDYRASYIGLGTQLHL